MRLKIYVILSILALCGCSENNEIEECINKADQLIEEHPDSAFSMLNAIDVDALRNGSELQARYALTFSRAQYKAYIDPVSDSLISIATEYYENYGSDEEKFYAYLYQGVIRSLLGEKRQSSHSLYRALSYSDSVDDHYHKGQLFMYLSSLYAGVNNKECLRFARSAAREYAEADLISYYINASGTEAIAMLRQLDYESAGSLLDSLHTLAFSVNDTASICDVLSVEANYAILQGELESAAQIYEQLQNYNYELTDQDMGNLSNLLAKQSKKDEAYNRMSSVRQLLQTEGDSLLYYTNMLILSKEFHDDNRTICLQDTIVSICQHLLLAEQEHAEYAEKCDYLELKQHKERTRNQMIRGYLVSGLIILVFILLLMSSILQKNRVMAKMQKAVIENLKLELALHRQERIDALKLLKTKLYTELLKSKIEEKKGLTQNEVQFIYQVFDEYLPNFQKALLRLASLSDTELIVCYLIKAGISPNEIAILINRTAQAISLIRARLYEKVFRKKGKPSDWDTFINSI